jgi:hypothetical protein
MIEIIRSFDPDTNLEVIEIESNFAFVEGGYDVLNGGIGPDVMIGGLGPDLFFGNTQVDILAGDAFTGRFEATFAEDFVGPTPFRELIGGNFAGVVPVDILTFEQVLSAIGVFGSDAGNLLEAPKDTSFVPSNTFILAENPIDNAGTNPSDLILALRAIEAFFDNELTIKRIAELVFYGTDEELIFDDILAAFKEYLAAEGLQDSDVGLPIFERMLQQVLEDVTLPTSSLNEPTAAAKPGLEAAIAIPA